MCVLGSCPMHAVKIESIFPINGGGGGVLSIEKTLNIVLIGRGRVLIMKYKGTAEAYLGLCCTDVKFF